MHFLKDIPVNLNINYDISTSINGKEICTEVICKDLFTGTLYQVSKRIMDTTDEQVRKGLIDLGWNPPEEKE